MKMHVMASGSKGNASIIYDDKTTILVDMGLSKSSLCNGLAQVGKSIKNIDYALFTHNHSDHIMGAKFIPFKVRYGREGTVDMPEENFLSVFKEYTLGTFKVIPLLTSHDALAPCGFLFKNNEDTLVYITDSGYIPEETLKLIINCDEYFIESNHDLTLLANSARPQVLKDRISSDFGHLSNEQSAKYMTYLVGDRTKEIVLAHLSEECNTVDVALNTYKRIFEEQGVSLSKIELKCAYQYKSVDL